MKKYNPLVWIKENRQSVQIVAFILLVVLPFLLFWTLQGGMFFMAALTFGGIALAMLLILLG